MADYLLLFIGTVLVNNFVLVKFLGLCPFMGVSKKLETAMGMGLATTFVMTLASICAWLIDTWILIPLNLVYLRTLAFILVIAVVVQFTEMVVRKTSPALYRLLGIFLPLITTNCAVLGVALLNINLGHNRELMDNCRKLWEYAVFVERIRERLAAGEQLEDAVKQAVDICMKEGVLADILRTQRAEVEELMWAEFNEERFIAKEKEYSWEDGNKAGKVKGRAESILEILEELGTVPEELRRRLLEETDLQRLKNWLKEAIKAASIEDFTENMDK